MQYKGTDIDGLSSDMEGLEVRGTDLCQLIGRASFPEAILALLNGEPADAGQRRQADRYLLRCLQQLDAAPPCPAGLAGTAGLAVQLLALPHDFGGQPEPHVFRLGGDAGPALAGAAVLPALAAQMARTEAERGAVQRAAAAEHDYVSALFRFITGRAPRDAVELAAFDGLLVAWHGGFGIVTPTVLAPRVVAGTGAPPIHALAAGVLAAGPRHIGASAAAFRLMAGVVAAVTAGAALQAAVADAIAACGAATGLVPGIGHPLLEQDPRPQRLRMLADGLERRLPLLVYDEFVRAMHAAKNLGPNVDLSTAAVLLSLGVAEAEVATAVALGARAFCMLAHVTERQAKPAFGADKASARQGYARLEVNWL